MPRLESAKRRVENEIEFSRIVAFSDGVFAIAITLLVLNLSVPEHIKGDDLFGEVTGFDGRLLTLNLFYLAWIVLIPFSSQVLGDHGGDEPAPSSTPPTWSE